MLSFSLVLTTVAKVGYNLITIDKQASTQL